jgi:GxxExxY protein
MAVHTKLGPGFLEAVYKEAMGIELSRRGIAWKREVWFPVVYDGVPLAAKYRCDLLCDDTVVIEVKAVEAITDIHAAQLINYLKAGNHPVGLLLNFRSSRLDYRRFVGPAASASSRQS